MSGATITTFHDPACGTSRNTLALIRNSGVEPRVVAYQPVIDAISVKRGRRVAP